MEDDTDVEQLRWVSGMLLGALFALLPLILGRYDVQRTLIVSAIAAAAVLPFWRHVGSGLNRRIALVPLLELIVGPALVALWFSVNAIPVFIGAYVCAVSAIRYTTRWRN